MPPGPVEPAESQTENARTLDESERLRRMATVFVTPDTLISTTLPAFGFSAYHGHTGAIHFDIQNRNAGPGHDGQIELEGPLDLNLLVLCDVLTNRFGVSFHGFSRDRQAGQQFHLGTAPVE